MEPNLSREVWVNDEEKIATFKAQPCWRHLTFPAASDTLRFLSLLVAQGYRFQ